MKDLRSESHLIPEIFELPRRILLTTHKSPDGDAIGSMLGLFHTLTEMGHTVTAAAPDNFPAFLNWMPGIENVRTFDTPEGRIEIEHAVQVSDLHISLDYNALQRLGEAMQQLCETFTGESLLIDHHREPCTTYTYSYHSIDASSTAELVYDFISIILPGHAIRTDVAQCLYAGIVTDTGSFRFPSASAHTLRVVAGLKEAGLNHAEVYNNIFDTNSLDRLRLLGYVLSSKLTVLPEFNTAYICLSAADLERFQYKPGDSEGFVNYALSVEGVQFACLLKENGSEVRISLRSKGQLDVNSLARQYFSGGGHLNAAGGRLPLPLAQAEQTFLEVVHHNRSLLTNS
jgi:phosphoesterase RecJ-like protein